MKMEAHLSRCESYRYTLTRQWGDGNRFATFVALNPSTADETQDDPTVRRMIGFAKSWGMDGLHVTNIFALRSTDPKVLRRHGKPVGPQNDRWILECCLNAEIVVAAWGNHGILNGRGASVLQLLRSQGVDVQCLGMSGMGQPKHPLYLPASAKLRAVG